MGRKKLDKEEVVFRLPQGDISLVVERRFGSNFGRGEAFLLSLMNGTEQGLKGLRLMLVGQGWEERCEFRSVASRGELVKILIPNGKKKGPILDFRLAGTLLGDRNDWVDPLKPRFFYKSGVKRNPVFDRFFGASFKRTLFIEGLHLRMAFPSFRGRYWSRARKALCGPFF